MEKTTRGILITLEGTDGSGKSTLLGAVADFFRRLGREPVLTMDPGGTPAGEEIRRLILRKDREGAPLDPWAEAWLYLASRRQLVGEVIAPALACGRVVLCDRFSDSTIAYQGFGRGLPLEALVPACELAARATRPDLTLWLDIEPADGLARSGPADRIESAGENFLRTVREGYRHLAETEPDRFRRIEAGATPGETFRRARLEITAFLAGRPGFRPAMNGDGKKG